MNKKLALFIALAITLLIFINFFAFSTYSSENSSKKTIIIAKIIDGDTLKTADNTTIRLLNINSPEKNTASYKLSMDFLKQFENKSVEAEIKGIDKYQRTLARIYSPDYLNLALVSLGYASKFLVDESELKKFSEAEKNALKSNLGIWKKSEFDSCFVADIDEKEEIIILKNKCLPINLAGFTLKDESRKIYKFNIVLTDKIALHSGAGKDNETDLFWNQGNVWNNDRDTLYLFDKDGGIAYYEDYGY